MKIDEIVNKQHPLDKDYVPKDLVKDTIIQTPNLDDKYLTYLNKEAYENFLEFREYGLYNGVNIIIDSGYRPYKYQQKILLYNLIKHGMDAYKTVAIPGTSEHQTGLALDFALIINNFYVEVLDDFYEEVKWVHENAYKFGFILRYPKGKEEITGFNYECWHLRYVGKEVSQIMHDEKIETLEEYHVLKKTIHR
ncbi:MAG: M15 family metallopeptidase [Bacilli bacterium]